MSLAVQQRGVGLTPAPVRSDADGDAMALQAEGGAEADLNSSAFTIGSPASSLTQVVDPRFKTPDSDIADIPPAMRAAFERAFRAPYKPGDSHEDIWRLLREIEAQDPSLLDDSSVLMFFRNFSDQNAFSRNSDDLVMLSARENGVREAMFHLVLCYGGHIFDLSFGNAPRIVPAREYFSEMLLSKEKITRLGIDVSDAARRLRLEKMNTFRFEDPDDLLGQIFVRVIPAGRYFNLHYNWLMGRLGFGARLKEDPIIVGGFEYLSEPLSKFFGLGFPPSAFQCHPIPAVSIRNLYRNGTLVEADRQGLTIGDFSWAGGVVTISRDGQRSSTRYNRTNRGIELLRGKFYPASQLDLSDLAGRVVVDMATGGGLLPEELHELGIRAFGLDVVLSPRQRARQIFHQMVDGRAVIDLNRDHGDNIFIEADAFDTGLPDRSVERIFETFGVLHYERYSSMFQESPLREWRRILKVGGRIRIAPVDKFRFESIETIVEKIHGLEIVDFYHPEDQPDENQHSVEFVRTY